MKTPMLLMTTKLSLWQISGVRASYGVIWLNTESGNGLCPGGTNTFHGQKYQFAINNVLSHSPCGKLKGNSEYINHWNMYEKYK